MGNTDKQDREAKMPKREAELVETLLLLDRLGEGGVYS